MYKHNFTLRSLTLTLFLSAYLPAIAQLHIGNGTHWVSDNSTWVVLDDISLKHDGATALPDNRFKFTGKTNSAISGASLPAFGVIVVAKEGTAQIMLQRNINIVRQVIFESGLFNLNSHTVNLGPAALVLAEREHTRFIGNNGGFISINVLINVPATAVNPGNLGAIITPSKNMGSVLIRRGHQVQFDERAPRNTSIQRFYDINPSINTNLNATLRFLYFEAELAGKNESRLELFRSINTSNTRWDHEGFTSRNTVNNYVEKTGINSFSRWTLGDPMGISPRITSITSPNKPTFQAREGKTLFIINVYPSFLTTNSLYIQTGNAGVKKMTIKIVDMKGQMVVNRELSYQPQWLYLPPLSSGNYSLQILSDKWKYSGRFVK